MIRLDASQITDVLPDNIKATADVQSLSYALMLANQRMIAFANKSRVYAAINELPSDVLDLLAVELRSQYYDNGLPIEIKRTIVTNTLLWYKKAGTPSAIEELIASVFGSGKVVEWFETNGEPGTFDVTTDAPLSQDIITRFNLLINSVKNTRSHLRSVFVTRTIENNARAGIASNIIGNIVITNQP